MSGHSNHSALLATNSDGWDLKAISRFYVNIQASGTFKPDKPIQVTVSVRANLPTKNAEIRLFLPGIHALKNKKRGQRAIVPVGKPLKPQASWSQSLSKGQIFRKQKTIVVNQPGYYHVFVKVIAKNGKKITKRGTPIVNSHWSDTWLWISSKGGKMTNNFQYELFPKSMRPQPGPLTPKTKASPLQYGKVRPNGQQGSITFQVSYLDKYIGNVYKPLKNAWIKYKVQFNGGYHWTQTYTNSQGIAVIPCYFSSGTYTVKVKNKNSNVKVYNGPHGSFGNNTLAVETAGNIATDCGQVKVIQSTNSYDFATFNQVIANSRSFFQHSRGQISVYRIYNDNSEGGNSGYLSGGDYIIINDYYVGSDYGDFGIAHEYGHALQNKVLGGIPSYNCSSGSNEHYIVGTYNLKCAYFEGFADYHAAVTFSYQNISLNIENNSTFFGHPYYEGCLHFDEYGFCTEYASEPDGPIVEGAVAAFLFDLTDPANESFDNAHYPGSYVANVIKTCQPKLSGNWKSRANGIDELIACFQNSLPNYSNYFPTRSPIPTNYQENATEPSGWNASDIKELWYKDLYDQNYMPPPPSLSVTVSGPTSINPNYLYTWHASTYGPVTSIKWYVQSVNTGGYILKQIGSSSTFGYSFSNPTTEYQQVGVMAKVFGSGGQVASDVLQITLSTYNCGSHLNISEDSLSSNIIAPCPPGNLPGPPGPPNH